MDMIWVLCTNEPLAGLHSVYPRDCCLAVPDEEHLLPSILAFCFHFLSFISCTETISCTRPSHPTNSVDLVIVHEA